MDLLSSMLTRPLPLAVRLMSMAVSSRPPLPAIASPLLLSSFSDPIDSLALVPPRLCRSPSALLAILCALPVRPRPPVLRLPSAPAAAPRVVMSPRWPLLVARPGDRRGVQPAMGAVVMVVALAAPPAICGLSPLQGSSGRTRAPSTTAAASCLASVFVESRLPVELVHGMVLAKAKV